MAQNKTTNDRDSELDSKIKKYTEVYTNQKITITTYGKTRTSSKVTKFLGWSIIGSHALALMFFSVLFILSYIPQTKNIVTMVMP